MNTAKQLLLENSPSFRMKLLQCSKSFVAWFRRTVSGDVNVTTKLHYSLVIQHEFLTS